MVENIPILREKKKHIIGKEGGAHYSVTIEITSFGMLYGEVNCH